MEETSDSVVPIRNYVALNCSTEYLIQAGEIRNSSDRSATEVQHLEDRNDQGDKEIGQKAGQSEGQLSKGQDKSKDIDTVDKTCLPEALSSDRPDCGVSSEQDTDMRAVQSSQQTSPPSLATAVSSTESSAVSSSQESPSPRTGHSTRLQTGKLTPRCTSPISLQAPPRYSILFFRTKIWGL